MESLDGRTTVAGVGEPAVSGTVCVAEETGGLDSIDDTTSFCRACEEVVVVTIPVVMLSSVGGATFD